jgi:hypothetical protein
MLIGVAEATRKIPARAVTTAAPPTASGRAAATTDPKTNSRASAASGSEISSLRRRSDSVDVAVERRPAGQADLDLGHVHEGRPNPRQGQGRVVGREVDRDDVVGRVAVG